MTVDLSYLVKGPGGINYLNLPLTATSNYSVPISKPNINSSSFSSSGNFSQPEGTSYYADFTINASHQMTITGPTTIVCSGTVTIGGNGIVGATTANALPGGKLEYFDGFSKMPSAASAVGRSSGGDGGGNSFGGAGAGGARGVAGGYGTANAHGGGGGGSNANSGGGEGTSNGSLSRGARQLGLLTIIADAIVVSGDINFDGLDGTSGSNSGNSGGQGGNGGAGGGNSGFLFMFSNTFTQTAGNITANAGDGGNGSGEATSSEGKGGGGGGGDCGLIFNMSKTFTISGGTITAAVGTGGSFGAGSGIDGTAGTDGSYIMEFGTGVVCIEGDPFRA